jgi:imidazolonepropionase-like amidohydrolase
VPVDGEVDQALAGRVAEAGIAVGPTLATSENFLDGPGLPPYARAEENVSRLVGAGVTILAGTDAPNPGTVFGASLHRELELLGRCGLTPAQALNAATAAPARVFNLPDRGNIAPGQRADLLLVAGDPLAGITATRAITGIWRAGVRCGRQPFVPSAAEAEELAAFDARVASAVAAVRERRYGSGPATAAGPG